MAVSLLRKPFSLLRQREAGDSGRMLPLPMKRVTFEAAIAGFFVT